MGAGNKSTYSSNGTYKRGCCSGCIIRAPYATIIAVIMNLVGVGIFCYTFYWGVVLSLRILQDTFRLNKGLDWVEPTKLTFIILGASMAGLSIMILVVSSLATGSTRHEVYRTSSGRTYGRIACIIFIGIIYFLLVCWLIVFACNVIMLMVYSIYWGVCGTPEIKDWRDDGKIDFYQFHFLFPAGTMRSEMEVHGTNEIKQFCKDYVQNAVQEFILSSIGCFIVILSLAHFLMVLSANYAHIRGHDKFTELQDLQDIHSETMTLQEAARGIQDGTYPWQNK